MHRKAVKFGARGVLTGLALLHSSAFGISNYTTRDFTADLRRVETLNSSLSVGTGQNDRYFAREYPFTAEYYRRLSNDYLNRPLRDWAGAIPEAVKIYKNTYVDVMGALQEKFVAPATPKDALDTMKNKFERCVTDGPKSKKSDPEVHDQLIEQAGTELAEYVESYNFGGGGLRRTRLDLSKVSQSTDLLNFNLSERLERCCKDTDLVSFAEGTDRNQTCADSAKALRAGQTQMFAALNNAASAVRGIDRLPDPLAEIRTMNPDKIEDFLAEHGSELRDQRLQSLDAESEIAALRKVDHDCEMRRIKKQKDSSHDATISAALQAGLCVALPYWASQHGSQMAFEASLALTTAGSKQPIRWGKRPEQQFDCEGLENIWAQTRPRDYAGYYSFFQYQNVENPPWLRAMMVPPLRTRGKVELEGGATFLEGIGTRGAYAANNPGTPVSTVASKGGGSRGISQVAAMPNQRKVAALPSAPRGVDIGKALVRQARTYASKVASGDAAGRNSLKMRNQASQVRTLTDKAIRRGQTLAASGRRAASQRSAKTARVATQKMVRAAAASRSSDDLLKYLRSNSGNPMVSNPAVAVNGGPVIANWDQKMALLQQREQQQGQKMVELSYKADAAVAKANQHATALAALVAQYRRVAAAGINAAAGKPLDKASQIVQETRQELREITDKMGLQKIGYDFASNQVMVFENQVEYLNQQNLSDAPVNNNRRSVQSVDGILSLNKKVFDLFSSLVPQAWAAPTVDVEKALEKWKVLLKQVETMAQQKKEDYRLAHREALDLLAARKASLEQEGGSVDIDSQVAMTYFMEALRDESVDLIAKDRSKDRQIAALDGATAANLSSTVEDSQVALENLQKLQVQWLESAPKNPGDDEESAWAVFGEVLLQSPLY